MNFIYYPLWRCDLYFPPSYPLILIDFGHIVGPKSSSKTKSSWKTVVIPIVVVAGSLLFLYVTWNVVARLLVRRENRPLEQRPLINERDGQMEESSHSDEVYVTPPSTMTSMQDEPALTEPTVAL